ncbi:MAG: hypothetical protein WC091_09570 [Sulfuricellaceae bacterium]
MEIGSGMGDVVSLPCFLGFHNVVGFEADPFLADVANRKVEELFARKGVVRNEVFPCERSFRPDVLVQVNCVYGNGLCDKIGYLERLKQWYALAGKPAYYVLEVIDDSFLGEHADYPEFLRVNANDIARAFPDSFIRMIPTYSYPANKSSKTIYVIEDSRCRRTLGHLYIIRHSREGGNLYA